MSALADADFAAWVAEARAVGVAEEVARRGLALKRAGGELVGPCPVCGGRDRFSVNLRKDVWHCRGSGRGGDAIALAEYLDGGDFLAACETLTRRPPPRGEATRPSPQELAEREAGQRRRREQEERARARSQAQENSYREAERRRLFALWQGACKSLEGTPAEAYLALRGIPDPRSRALRFHADMPYFDGTCRDERGREVAREIHRGPALLGAITDAGGVFRGLHITWIDLARPKGKAEIIAPDTGEVLPAKKVRGSMRGHAILLRPAAEAAVTVYAGEGIETVLSVWAALAALGRDLSTSAFVCAVALGNLAGPARESVPHPSALKADAAGRRRLVKVPGEEPDWGRPAMWVPAECRELVLLADGDSEPYFTRCALARAQARHGAAGRMVRVAWPPEGADFNDLLMAESLKGESHACEADL